MSTTPAASPPAAPAPAPAPEGQVNIEIDGVALHAPKGSMVIQAADRAGIPIPRFCYHPKLAIAANCRMCLVDIEKSPKPAPACATPVMEGMKVQTQTKRALDAQRNVMEFLLINHPLDCPICDQGGECELQDVSLGYGRSISRFVERKRVVADEDLGPLIETEMTRCIHCTRCVRFTAEVAGTYELGAMYRGEDMQIGTYDGKPLMTELSGNVIDVCPVGALTNKVYRFRARPWELTARESLGYHDALGSNLYLHVRRGDVMRTVPRDNEAVNECWLSDRDRYSHQGLYAEDRALRPLIRVGDGAELSDFRAVSWDEAIALAAQTLKAQAGDGLGVLVHPATSNEEGVLLADLAARLGCAHVDHRIGMHDLSDAAIAEPFAVPVDALSSIGAALLVGCNPRHEVPLLHHRLHQAGKRGAALFAINPVDFDFAFRLSGKRVVTPSDLLSSLSSLTTGDAIYDALKAAAGKAVIVLGEIAETHPDAAAIRSAARRLASELGAGLNRIPQGANAVGLARQGVLPTVAPIADAGSSGLDALEMFAQPRAAYLIYGIEPGMDFADPALAVETLQRAKVVAFSHYACASTRRVADVILPIGLLPEIEATLTNLDGIDQSTVAGGKLPGDARPGWRVLRALGGQLGLSGFDFTDLAGARTHLRIASRAPRTDDTVAASPTAAGPAPSPTLPDDTSPATERDGSSLERVTTTAIYRSDATVRRAAALSAHPLTRGARVVLHPQDAAVLGLTAGAIANVADARGTATLPVALDARLAQGAAWIERGYAATGPLTGHGRLTITGA